MENPYAQYQTATIANATSLPAAAHRALALQDFSLPPAGTEKELAILFLDIRNFTGLMESKPAKEVIQVVHNLFHLFNQIIKNFQGTIVEVAGDSIYAIFGLGATIKDTANQAWQASKMMFQTVSLFNEAFSNHYDGRPLEIGVGLHTGKVVIAQLELNSNQQLSVMGLPVNVASRLQSKTKELNNDMIVSEEAYSLLQKDRFNHEQRMISLQGLSSPQKIRLLGKPYQNRFTADESEFDIDYVMAFSG